MTQSLIARSFSFFVAAVMTAAMLGGIDHLSQPDAGTEAGQWAQKAPVSRG